MIVGAGIFLLGTMLAVNLALGHHADRLLDSATLAGARHGARHGGSTADAILVADDRIDRTGRALFEEWSTTASVEVEGGRRRIVVRSTARLAGPLGGWSVSATGSAVVEEFVAQDGGS